MTQSCSTDTPWASCTSRARTPSRRCKSCASTISRKAQPGMLVYTSLCTEDGGIFDDLVVFCLAPDHYLLTMAAFNTHKTPGWVERHTAGMNVCVMDLSAGTTCIEIQGPKSRRILQRIADVRRFGPGASLLPIRHRQGRRHRLPGRASRRDRRARLRNLLRRRLRLDDVRCVRDRPVRRTAWRCAATARSAPSGWKRSTTSTRATSTRPPTPMRPASAGR